MSLQRCMAARGLAGHAKPGLRALGKNSIRVNVSNPRKATGSIDLDAALRASAPTAARWDYGIGLSDGSQHRVAWVEVHHATSSEVDAVMNKLRWLKGWLVSNTDACCNMVNTYHWVATDAGVHIDTARRRKLNSAGLSVPQSLLRL